MKNKSNWKSKGKGKDDLNNPLLGELDVNSSFDEEKGNGFYTGPEIIKAEEHTQPLSSDDQSGDDEEKGDDLNIGLIEELSSPLVLDDEEKGGETSDTVLPTNDDAIKLLETCLSLNVRGTIAGREMNEWLFLLVIRLASAANYYEPIPAINRTNIERVMRKFVRTTTSVFEKNEQNQDHFKVAYYLFFKIFCGIMRNNFNNSIPVLDYSSPMNRAMMRSDIDARLKETKKSFEPYEVFVAEQVDHVKIQWAELLAILRDPHAEGQFTGVNVGDRDGPDAGNIINDFFDNVFDEINNATSMDALERILETRGTEAESTESLRDPGYPFDLNIWLVYMSQGSAILFTGAGFITAPDGRLDHCDIAAIGLTIGVWCIAAIWQAVTLRFLADYILSRSANTWLENLLNGIDAMQPILTDAKAAIHAKQTELFGRGGATAVEAHRASIRKIERGEQQFEKCMEFIASFYALQASHPDGLEKLQKLEKQLALIRYCNEPDAQQTHKEYIETGRDLTVDNDWFNDQGVVFAIDDAQVYDAQEDDINNTSSTTVGSLISCGMMSSTMKDKLSIMDERKEEKEEEEDEEADIENQLPRNGKD